jgi:ABC-type molybdate transport system substrate-binding protein
VSIKKALPYICALGLLAAAFAAPANDYLPPWRPLPQDGKHFMIPEIDVVSDLYGDAVKPQLVVFFAGNQFMVVNDLVSAFRKAHPEIQRIYVETLPPGILAQQIEQGALVMGNLRIELKPDVYTAGAKRIGSLQAQHHWFANTEDYASNRLALMVYRGNPEHIQGLKDLGRTGVRVSMPNPKWEGIARAIEATYRKAGGDDLERQIMRTKVEDGTTHLTQIHHRQTPLRILRRQSDVGPVWYTEAYFQQSVLHHPISLVEIPADQNARVTYTAALLKDAPHTAAGQAFMAFLVSPEAQAIYRRYAFEPAGR